MKSTVFISHASEDKRDVARPLAVALRRRKIDVWYDEYSLRLGDSLRASIDRGLADCDFGVVVFSKDFFGKAWPQEEVDGLFTRQLAERRKIIFPIWHRVTSSQVRACSPLLAGKKAANTKEGIPTVADQICSAMKAEEQKRNLFSQTLKSPSGGFVSFRAVPNPASTFISQKDVDDLLFEFQRIASRIQKKMKDA
jgi:hypothetical protein